MIASYKVESNIAGHNVQQFAIIESSKLQSSSTYIYIYAINYTYNILLLLCYVAKWYSFTVVLPARMSSTHNNQFEYKSPILNKYVAPLPVPL